MDKQQAHTQIMKAIDDHENARITKAALTTIVGETISSLYEDGYEAGLVEGWDAESSFEEDGYDYGDLDDNERE